MPHSPVFVLGVPRSGTSVVQLGLLEQCGYAGQGEGHVAPLLGRLLAAVETYWRESSASQIDGTSLNLLGLDALRQAAHEALRTLYRMRFEGRDFSDKTPGIESIGMAPQLQETFPGARFIYCQRRGLENVASKLRKFPERPFEIHCSEWSDTVMAWRNVRKELDYVLELDQLEIARAPVTSARRVGRFLDLDDGAVVALGGAFRVRQVQRTSEEPGRILALEDFDWTEEHVATFRVSCGATMELAGYRYGTDYWTRQLPEEVGPEVSQTS